MFPKQKGWFSGGGGKPKNPHSLEHLKYLYTVLSKNQTVTEHNKTLLVETLRSMSEMLIWGDQNDSSVFDFFLEKNMLSFFTIFMEQKTGTYICTQLLQTLNILFENIRNETSLYFLLSNNHINMIILHKFDFSDEEVMAYYISFLKSLSLKLNKHTVHFFYNEHTNDFALYTEAIKFFNHPENMVRIAVRTITLNVFKACLSATLLDASGRPVVEDETMLRYIRDKTAVPYFSNLVWFIGNHVLLLDTCVRHDTDHNSRDRLSDLVAEHLNHLHYLNDILSLNITALNEVLTDHLLNNLFLPLYVYSLTKCNKYMPSRGEKPHLSSVVSLFLLSQVFLIIQHAPVVRPLADIIFNCDLNMCAADELETSPSRHKVCEFLRPAKLLSESLQTTRLADRRSTRKSRRDRPSASEKTDPSLSTFYYESQLPTVTDVPSISHGEVASSAVEGETDTAVTPSENSTDEQKLLSAAFAQSKKVQADFSLADRPYLRAIFNTLDCSETDYETLFSLSLLYALGNNPGINQELLDTIFMPTDKSERKDYYNVVLVEKLIGIVTQACQHGSRVRLATLEMSVLLLKTLIYREDQCYLQDCHLAALEGAKEEATLLLRNFYKVWEKSEEIFLDMFEDEYREMKTRPVNVEYLTMDASILLPPTGTPLTGIEFNKRWPCGEVERARRAIRVFFLLRDLSLTLRGETEEQLPLTKHEECVHPGEILDLNNSDLIACVLVTKEGRKERYFLVIDTLQLILVEPEMRRLGWGVVTFVGYLQDVEITGDKDDSRSLHITVHKPSASRRSHSAPLLSGRFVFDDHIRCMAAKQRLTKGRLKARQRKMQMIARLLEMPTPVIDAVYQPSPSVRGSGAPVTARSAGSAFAASAIPGRSHPIQSQNLRRSKAGQPKRPTDAPYETVPRDGRPLQGKESTPPRPVPGRVGDSVGAAPHKYGDKPKGDEVDIEEAQEAMVSSPEVMAFQSLNQNQSGHRHLSRSLHKKHGQSGDMATKMQDIQMDDLSDSVLGSTRSRKPALRRVTSVSGAGRTRSSSHSPCSMAHQRGGGRRYRSSNSRQQEAVASDNCGRTASCPSLHLLASCSNIDANRRPSTTKRRLEGVPKTLAPAQAPSLSLVSSCDVTSSASNIELGSPVKILLPAAFEKIHNLSDSTSGNSLMSSSGASDDIANTRPVLKVGTCPAVGESTVSAEGVLCERQEQDGTTVKQLNLLAQVMSKHSDGHQEAVEQDGTLSEEQTSFLD